MARKPKPTAAQLKALVDAVLEILDNRAYEYICSEDREMLKEAVEPFEDARHA